MKRLSSCNVMHANIAKTNRHTNAEGILTLRGCVCGGVGCVQAEKGKMRRENEDREIRWKVIN